MQIEKEMVLDRSERATRSLKLMLKDTTIVIVRKGRNVRDNARLVCDLGAS